MHKEVAVDSRRLAQGSGHGDGVIPPWRIGRDGEAGTDFAAIDQLDVRDRDAASRADRRCSCAETAAGYDDIDRLSDQRALR